MLDMKLALKIACSLTAVKEFPRNQEAIDAVAEDFIDLTLQCEDIEAEKRCRWLVEQIRRTWDEWTGTADLIRLYRTRWPEQRELKPEDNEVKNYGEKPPIQCQVCNDTGVFKPGGPKSAELYRWCECEQGPRLHFELPGWLDTVNAEVEMPAKPPAIDLIHPAAVKPVSDKVEQAIQKTTACPACCEVRPHTHQEYWQYHTKQEINQ